MSARENILARLRQASPTARPIPIVDPRRVAAIVPPSPAFPVERLRANLEALQGEVVAVTASNWHAKLAELCATKGIASLATGSESGLPADWQVPAIRVLARNAEDWKLDLFDRVDAGLAHADCAIVDTGMLVVRSSASQPRCLSLVPPISFCVVDARHLYPTLLDAMQGERWEGAMPTNLIFISGPSKTADIQQTLAYGAHGPKELVVLLIMPEAPQ